MATEEDKINYRKRFLDEIGVSTLENGEYYYIPNVEAFKALTRKVRQEKSADGKTNEEKWSQEFIVASEEYRKLDAISKNPATSAEAKKRALELMQELMETHLEYKAAEEVKIRHEKAYEAYDDVVRKKAEDKNKELEKEGKQDEIELLGLRGNWAYLGGALLHDNFTDHNSVTGGARETSRMLDDGKGKGPVNYRRIDFESKKSETTRFINENGKDIAPSSPEEVTPPKTSTTEEPPHKRKPRGKGSESPGAPDLGDGRAFAPRESVAAVRSATQALSAEEIKQLQQRLKDAGYELGNFAGGTGVDGIVGRYTASAMLQYLMDQGMDRDAALKKLQECKSFDDFAKIIPEKKPETPAPDQSKEPPKEEPKLGTDINIGGFKAVDPAKGVFEVQLVDADGKVTHAGKIQPKEGKPGEWEFVSAGGQKRDVPEKTIEDLRWKNADGQLEQIALSLKTAGVKTNDGKLDASDIDADGKNGVSGKELKDFLKKAGIDTSGITLSDEAVISDDDMKSNIQNIVATQVTKDKGQGRV